MRAKDYSGQKYNKLTFVRSTNTRNNSGIVWELVCDCGNTYYANPSDVTKGSTKSCGCGRKENMRQIGKLGKGRKFEDYTGQKYKMLTFIRYLRSTKHGSAIWELRCECGNTCEAYANNVTKKLNGLKSCGCTQPDDHSKSGLKARKFDPIISSARDVWQGRYNDGDIDIDTFYHLSQQPCHYCGTLPSNVRNAARKNSSLLQINNGNFVYNGLDRVDPTKGHTLDNVVPCCFPCNWMKSDMTQEEFILHNERQYHYMTSMRNKLRKANPLEPQSPLWRLVVRCHTLPWSVVRLPMIVGGR